jgi:hypothetical protein
MQRNIKMARGSKNMHTGNSDRREIFETLIR